MAERALATAFVNIVPGTKDLELYLKNKLPQDAEDTGTLSGQRMGSGILGALKGFIGPIAAVLSVAALTNFAKDSVAAASDLNEAGTAVGAVFGTAAGKIDEWASKAATGLGQSKLQALDAAKSFGVYGSAAGLSAEANAEFSTGLAGLATDFASFYNVKPEEAIAAIGSGLRGEAEPLRRFGILMNDASLKAEAMKQGIYDGNGPLTNQQKILAAQSLIFAQAGAAQGDFARTGEGLANQQRIAAAQFENFKATLGTAFLPMVTTVVTYLNDSFIPALYGVLDGAKAAFNWIKDNSGWLIPVAIGFGILYLGLLLYGKGLEIAEKGIKNYAKASGEAMLAQLGLNTAMFANPIGLIIIAIVALIAALVWFFTQTELGKQVWENVMNAIGAAMTWLWESVLKPVWDAMLAAWQWLMDGFNFLWENVLKPVFDAIAAIFTWIWENILRPIVQAIVIIVLLLGMAFTWLWENAIKPAMDFIGAIFTWLWETIIKIVVDLIVGYVKMWAAIFTWLYENVLSPVFKFIADLFVWIWNNVVMPVVNLIIGIIQTLGAIFNWLYENVIKPVFKVIGDIFKWLWENSIKPLVDFAIGAFEFLGETMGNIFNGISDIVKNTFEGLLGIIRGPINAVIGFINMMIDGINAITIDIPEFARDLFGGASSIGFNIPKIPALAKGGFVDSPTTALIGEAGPEVVTPLKDFERMMGLDGNRDNKVLNYYAAPNTSMDSEKELFDSMRRAKVVAGW